MAGNNGWYLVGSSSRSATLEKEDGTGYAHLTKTAEKEGSYVLYRAFDSAVSWGKIVLDTDLYYEGGYMKFWLSDKTNTPNSSNSYKQRIDCLTIDNGKLLDGNGTEIGIFPTNEWTHITYTLDMDYGTQDLKVGDNQPHEYIAAGMDSINPSEITVSALQQLNISGSSKATLSARIKNTSVKNTAQTELPERTLTITEPDSAEGTVFIADSEGLIKTAKMNSLVTVSAIPADGYTFTGWYENDKLVSGTEQAQIRLHRDVTLTAKFEEESDPITYAYKEAFTSLTTDALADSGWVSASAQSTLTVKQDNPDTDKRGNYIYFNPNTSKARSAKGTFDVSEQLDEKYVIDMDFGISNGSASSGANSEFTILTSGTTVTDNSSVTGDYLLKLTATAKSGGSNTKSMTWKVNDDDNNTITLVQSGNNPVWAHLTMTVDPETENAEITVTQNSEEKYKQTVKTAVTNSNYTAAGLNFNAGRQYSKCQFDNIKIYTASQITQ